MSNWTVWRSFSWTCLGFLLGMAASRLAPQRKEGQLRPMAVVQQPEQRAIPGFTAHDLPVLPPAPPLGSDSLVRTQKATATDILERLRLRLHGDSWQSGGPAGALLGLDDSQLVELEAIALGSESPEDRLLAIRAILAWGGSAAARLIKALEASTYRPALEHMTIARAVGLEDGLLPKVNPIPLDSDLVDRAMQHLDSGDPWDRVLGAGLLAAHNVEQTRTMLTHIAESDVDMRARAAAIRALGAVGDASTLRYLTEYFVVSPHPAAESDIDVLEALRCARFKLRERCSVR